MPGMPGSPPPAGPFVYQLRVVPRGVSPLIWRRLLVRSDSSIADLHATLRFALGWSDEYLTALVVHSIASTRAANRRLAEGMVDRAGSPV